MYKKCVQYARVRAGGSMRLHLCMSELFTDIPQGIDPFAEELGDQEARVHLICEELGQFFTDLFES